MNFIYVYDTLSPNGYNLSSGGQNGYYFSVESRQKCSDSQRKTNEILPMYMYNYENCRNS